MTKSTTLLTTLLATSFVAACATDPDTQVLDPDDPSVPEPDCTPATESIPLDEIADHLAGGTGYLQDMVRAHDGTLYCVSDVDNDWNSTIGRRVPCGAFDDEWLSVTAPIQRLVISTDNQLYMSGFRSGTMADVIGRLLVLDLDDPSALPFSLVNQPGEIVSEAAAGPGGTMYFMQGWSDDTYLRIVSNGEVSDPIAVPPRHQGDRHGCRGRGWHLDRGGRSLR